MSNHFSAIGFEVQVEQDLADLLQKLENDLKQIPTRKGEYHYWRSKTGAELWFQIKNSKLIGLNPHYKGKSSISVGLVNKVERPHSSKLDGTIYAWANPSDDKTASGDYPFVWDLPDYDTYEDLHYPCTAKAQISAFAHEIKVFVNEDAFDKNQDEKIKYAPQSFIPTGLFKSGAEKASPEPYALLNGLVLEAEVKNNEITGKKFTWALVESLGGKYDVIVDPVLYAGKIEKGNVVSAVCWLSGRLITYQKVKKGILGKLFS